MIAPIGSRHRRRFLPSLAALLFGGALIAGCSPASGPGPASSGPGSGPGTATGPADPKSPQDAAASDDTPSAAPEQPATTAQPPVAWYPTDPAVEPVVDLGPPPAAYPAPRAECPPEAKACVDLTNNMTWLQVDGAVVFGPIQHIAGRPGYRTTPGMHVVSWKHVDHVSSVFGTPMPYAVFFTSSGIAFHEGLLSEPSHGCVHLTHEAALAYWDNLRPGDRVFVFGEAQY